MMITKLRTRKTPIAAMISAIILSGCGSNPSDSPDAPHLIGVDKEDIITLNIAVSGDGNGSISFFSDYVTEGDVDPSDLESNNPPQTQGDGDSTSGDGGAPVADAPATVRLELDCPVGGYCIYQVPRDTVVNVTARAEGDSYALTTKEECNFPEENICSFTAQQSGQIDFGIVLHNVEPVANDDGATTEEDRGVSLNVLENDYDINQNALAISSITESQDGAISFTNDGIIQFTPNENFNGSTEFQYTVTDGELSASAKVVIDVIPVNDNPIADRDYAETQEDQVVDVEVLSNDSDVDGDTLEIVEATSTANGSVQIFGDFIQYTPQENFVGSDTFTYRISDGHGGYAQGEVTVNVGGVNDDPTATDDVIYTDEDQAITFYPLDNDFDIDGDEIKVVAHEEPLNGTAVVNPDNSVTYTPVENFHGNDLFTYEISDDSNYVDQGLITVEITPVNDNPIAVEDVVSTNEEESVLVDVLSNDDDIDSESLSIESFTQGNNGTVSLVDGQLSYNPDSDFAGVDSFSYTVQDENGGSATTNVTIDVGDVNDDPISIDDEVSTLEDTSLNILPLTNDSDIDEDELTITEITTPRNGTAEITGPDSVRYEPNSDYNGSDSFIYTVVDGKGGLDRGEVRITIDPVNDNPVALEDSFSTPYETPVEIDVLANDVDPEGGVLQVSLNSHPLETGSGLVDQTESGTLLYTPNFEFEGEDTFIYSAIDSEGGHSEAVVTIHVGTGNLPPVAVADTAITQMDTSVDIDYLANDYDPEGDHFGGVVENDGNWIDTLNGQWILGGLGIVYMPNAGFVGIDQFTYRLYDGEPYRRFVSGTVTVTVEAAPEEIEPIEPIEEEDPIDAGPSDPVTP